MTLSTYLYVHGFAPPREFLAELRKHLAQYDKRGVSPDQHRDIKDFDFRKGGKTIGNEIGQGLPSMLLVTYGADGPLVTDAQAAEHGDYCDDGCDGSDHEPAHFIEVNWDTAYGYRDPQVGGCSDLHARLLAHAGQLLDAQRVEWSWRNEFTGEIHRSYDGLDEFTSDDYRPTESPTRTWLREQGILPSLADAATTV